MTDEQVLNMSARRFWLMERQISRIQSEGDLRQINVERACTSANAYKDVIERLTLDLGETHRIRHSLVVKPEADVKEKFASILG